MAGVETGHDHAALALPDLVVGEEKAFVEAHFTRDAPTQQGPAKALGPFAQQRLNGGMVGHDQNRALAEAALVARPVLPAPGFKLEMQPGRAKPQRLTQPR